MLYLMCDDTGLPLSQHECIMIDDIKYSDERRGIYENTKHNS